MASNFGATVAVGLKSSATAVELLPLVQHWPSGLYVPKFYKIKYILEVVM